MQKALVTFTLAAFLLLPGIVSAESPSPTRKPDLFRANSQSPKPSRPGEDVRRQAKELQATRQAERKLILDENRKERLSSFWEKMLARLEAATERLEKLIERIQSRIDKIEAEKPDEDTTDEQAQLDEAEDLLEATKLKIEALKDDFEDVLDSDEPKDSFKTVGENVRDIKQDLVEIHTMLVKIIGDIKGLRVGQKSPSVSVEPSASPI